MWNTGLLTGLLKFTVIVPEPEQYRVVVVAVQFAGGPVSICATTVPLGRAGVNVVADEPRAGSADVGVDDCAVAPVSPQVPVMLSVFACVNTCVYPVPLSVTPAIRAAEAPGALARDSVKTEPAPSTTARHITMMRCRRARETVCR
jgi:hypothetical protein